MSADTFVTYCTFQANTAEPALPGRWCCPLEGLRAAAPSLPVQAWTAAKSCCLRQRRGASAGRFEGEL